MKNFLQLIKQPTNHSKFKITTDCFGNYYTPLNYNSVKDFGGMKLMTEVLRHTNDAAKRQRYLTNDANLLVEKVFAKIEWKQIIVDYQISHQILCNQYSFVLHTNGLWPMLLEKFVNYDVIITEQEFRPVAGIIMKCLRDLESKEKNYIDQIANSCIHPRKDGRLEIVFPGKLWGGKKVVEHILRLAEKRGICIIETNTSPIKQKVVLPYGWSVSDYTDGEGYYFILDDFGRKIAVFRVTWLPNELNNGEVDFFMLDDDIDKIPNKDTPKLNGTFIKSLLHKKTLF